jgi:hypothetical protein
MSGIKKSRFNLSRFNSLLLCAGLLANLVCFAHDRAYAQAASAEIGVQSPPHSLNRQVSNQQGQAEPQQPAPGGNDRAPPALGGPEQRVALVIGNSNYQNAQQLANPDNDAQSMAQFLNQAGFEVIAATDLTQNDMIKVVQDFSGKVAARGPNTVAMIYYAGHGVQLAGENYLVPVDAKISSPSDLVNNSVRLVDVMATLEAIPSRMRIVVLDACRNNPFPGINDAGRGLAIVDAPNGSIVGYSTAPGTEALDGAGSHSPYADAFLRLAREPNLPIEQLFKRVRLEVNHSTDGQQTPWESSSLTSDFYFFGDTAVAATRAPDQGHITQVASNLPGRAVRQAYDYVLAEGSPEHYQEFIEMFPNDPLCDRIRRLLGNLLEAAAWHKAVLANTPLLYKAFYESHGNSPYAQSALKLQSQPKIVPLLQPTRLIVPERLAPTFKLTNLGASKGDIGGLVHGGEIIHAPGIVTKQPSDSQGTSKIVTLPAQGATTVTSGTGSATGKIVNLPVTTVGKASGNQDLKGNGPTNHVVDSPTTPQHFRTDGHDHGVFKLNANPTQGNPPRGNTLPPKIGGGLSANPNPHFAQGPGRGGFAH